MENSNYNQDPEYVKQMENRSKKGKIAAGFMLILFGSLLLLKKSGVEIPKWLFSWEMFLIGLGLFIGFKHNFKGGSWLVLIALGGAFLLNDFMPSLNLHSYIWPGFFILLGLVMIFKRTDNRWFQKRFGNKAIFDGETTGEDYIDIVSIFGGTKKQVMSKNFKGGDIVSIFGGSEVNLIPSDFNGKIKLDCVQIFGGSKLVIPANWSVQSDVVAIFGGVDDRRAVGPNQMDPEKVIKIDGVCLFGGLTITSF